MEAAQRDYFVQRLNEIEREKVEAKRVELFGEGGEQQPTWGMVFAAIKSGDIVLVEGTENLTRPYLMPTDVEWSALDAKRKELAAYRRTVAADKQRALDAVMLEGTAQQALAEFAKA
jgi:hypothetical protein